MTHTAPPLRLSLEEVLYAVNLEAPPALADAIAAAVERTGLSRGEVLACVRTTGHSLLARGLLRVDDTGPPTLLEPLSRAARAVARPSYAIAFRRPGRAEFYYFGDQGICKQHVEDDVVHTLDEVDDRESVVRNGLAFFEIGSRQTTRSSVDMPLEVFNAIRQAGEPAAIREILAPIDAPEALCDELANDLTAPAYRGEIVRASYTSDGRPQPARSGLVLGGASRVWLIRESSPDGTALVSVGDANPDTFHKALFVGG